MRPQYHVVASTVTAFVFYFLFKEFKYCIVTFLAGIFIDLDHLFDYFLSQGINFRVKQFFDWCEVDKVDSLILFLHSIEFLIIFWILIWFFNLRLFWIALAVGFTQHLIFDLSANKVKPQGYLFFYRLKHSFNREIIL